MGSLKKQDIMVSVICLAYNHERFIRDALDGFVTQKTDFPFEVIVHDDASADGTSEIIREYEMQYPNLIKGIYQSQNMYSQGINITNTFIMPLVHGKYIALCEGDDYWTKPYKLQKQVDALENTPSVDMCAHLTSMTGLNGEFLGLIGPLADNDTIFSADKVIVGGGGFVATNSLMYRRGINDNMPLFRKIRPMDYTLQIQGSLRGGMLYLTENMSAYRYKVPGSWTMRMQRNPDLLIQHEKETMESLQALNEYTEGKYRKAITDVMLNSEWTILRIEKRYKELFLPKYKKIYANLDTLTKIKLKILCYCPFLADIKRTIYR